MKNYEIILKELQTTVIRDNWYLVDIMGWATTCYVDSSFRNMTLIN